MSERDFKGPASRCTPLRSVLDVEGEFVRRPIAAGRNDRSDVDGNAFFGIARELVKINRRVHVLTTVFRSAPNDIRTAKRSLLTSLP